MKHGYEVNIPLVESLRFAIKHLRNPWAIVPALLNEKVRVKIRGEKERTVFLNGKWQFWNLRDILLHGWDIVKMNDKIIFIRKGNIQICGNLNNLSVIKEPLEEYYRAFDYKGKVVLDVGGFIGYSAVLFSQWGAKKVIIYEPQRENMEIIRKNLMLNNVSGEVYNFAVSDQDGYVELKYNILGTTGFGLRGTYKYRVRSKAAGKILSSHDVDIAKFDCEGCEYSLLSVPCSTIQKIPKYVIEYHYGIEPLKKKFNKCGYQINKLWVLNSHTGGFKAESIK